MALCVGSCPPGNFLAKPCFSPFISGSWLVHQFGQEVTALWLLQVTGSHFQDVWSLLSFVPFPFLRSLMEKKKAQLAACYHGLTEEDRTVSYSLPFHKTETLYFPDRDEKISALWNDFRKVCDLSCSFHWGGLGHLILSPHTHNGFFHNMSDWINFIFKV